MRRSRAVQARSKGRRQRGWRRGGERRSLFRRVWTRERLSDPDDGLGDEDFLKRTEGLDESVHLAIGTSGHRILVHDVFVSQDFRESSHPPFAAHGPAKHQRHHRPQRMGHPGSSGDRRAGSHGVFSLPPLLEDGHAPPPSAVHGRPQEVEVGKKHRGSPPSDHPMNPGAPSFAADDAADVSQGHGPQRVGATTHENPGTQKHRGPKSDGPMSRWPDEPIHQGPQSVSGSPRHRAHHQDQTASPWSKRAEKGSSARRRASTPVVSGPYSEPELHEIAESSSQTERTADEAERELLEWKKLKFMEQRVGEDFAGLIVSVTKFGFFVELTELFIEGPVPLASLTDDHYTYHENTRQIIGQRSRKTYSIGDKLRVLVDRIDHLQRKIQFAVLEEPPTRAQKRHKKRG